MDKETFRRVTSHKNSYYAGLLQNLFSGSEGEVASFFQFRYQFCILSMFSPDLAETMKNIASQDLKHQEILSKLIIALGGNPAYISSQGKIFSCRSIDFVKDVRQMLSLDIEMKEKSIIDTRLAIQKIQNEDIISFLTRILLDEENHLEILRTLEKTLS